MKDFFDAAATAVAVANGGAVYSVQDLFCRIQLGRLSGRMFDGEFWFDLDRTILIPKTFDENGYEISLYPEFRRRMEDDLLDGITVEATEHEGKKKYTLRSGRVVDLPEDVRLLHGRTVEALTTRQRRIAAALSIYAETFGVHFTDDWHVLVHDFASRFPTLNVHAERGAVEDALRLLLEEDPRDWFRALRREFRADCYGPYLKE